MHNTKRGRNKIKKTAISFILIVMIVMGIAPIPGITQTDEVSAATYELGVYTPRDSDGLNLRAGRGTSYRVLTAIPYGRTFKVTEIKNGWGKTTYNNRTGYVSMTYARFVRANTVKTTTTNTTTTKTTDLRWPLSNNANKITSLYGYRNDVPGSTWHSGIDIMTPKPGETKVYAVADGTVRRVLRGYNGGYGNMIELQISLNGKSIYVRYCHLSEIRVKKGDTVKAGGFIGRPGNTGYSFGAHLHIDFRYARNGEYLNPLSLFKPTQYIITKEAKDGAKRY
ncbi:MAG: peptidoglycan DD-metalloendopeptidase family protein [Saccharofermentanales bacterium]